MLLEQLYNLSKITGLDDGNVCVNFLMWVVYCDDKKMRNVLHVGQCRACFKRIKDKCSKSLIS